MKLPFGEQVHRVEFREHRKIQPVCGFLVFRFVLIIHGFPKGLFRLPYNVILQLETEFTTITVNHALHDGLVSGGFV